MEKDKDKEGNTDKALLFCYYDFIKIFFSFLIFLIVTLRGVSVSRSLH